MAYKFKINDFNRTSDITRESVKKVDNLNNRVDTLDFAISKFPNMTYTPTVGDEVVVTDDSTQETSTVLGFYRFKISTVSTYITAAVDNLYFNFDSAPAGFWTNVVDGGDIRVTQADGSTEVACEVVHFDKGSNVGRVHFATDDLETVNSTDYYIYYGNPSNITRDKFHQYGAAAVWKNYDAVYHMGYEGNTQYDSSKNNLHAIDTDGGTTVVADGLMGPCTGFDKDVLHSLSVADGTNKLNYDGTHPWNINFLVRYREHTTAIGSRTNAIVSYRNSSDSGHTPYHITKNSGAEDYRLVLRQQSETVDNFFTYTNSDTTFETWTHYDIRYTFNRGGPRSEVQKIDTTMYSFVNFDLPPGETTQSDASTLWLGKYWAAATTIYNLDGELQEVRIKRGEVSFGEKHTEDYNQRLASTTTWTIGAEEDIVATSPENITSDLRIFGGTISEIVKTFDSSNNLTYNITVIDYSQKMDGPSVFERYSNTTLVEVLNDIIDKYASDFYLNLTSNTSTSIESITFNRITMSQALTDVARQLNMYWYVDYNKVINFFSKSDLVAPFNLTDTSDNFVYDSLTSLTDMSQLRNKITIKGGEAVSNTRTQLLSGTGTNKSFPLSYKFATEPTVTVGGVSQTVGTARLDSPEGFDCLWDYNQKNLEFADTSIPAAGTDNIAVTGDPLFPLVAYADDFPSQETYGLREYTITDAEITDRTDAVAYGNAQLVAYSTPIIDASFRTYTDGLKSGMRITINTPSREINDTFIINSIQMRLLSDSRRLYEVKLTTARTSDLIQILQDFFIDRSVSVAPSETLFGTKTLTDTATATDSIAAPTVTVGPYYYGPVTGAHQVGRWNQATYS